MDMSKLSLFFVTLSLFSCSSASNIHPNNLTDSDLITASGKKVKSDLEVQQERESFRQFIIKIREQAIEAGIKPQIVDEAFAGLELNEKVIKADHNQPEKKINLDQYLSRSLSMRRLSRAKLEYQNNYALLEQIASQYQVSPQYIVALWGIESYFGQLQGKEPVISALATLAYEGRRQQFFINQLLDALWILENEQIKPAQLTGSWAGAMGQCQFMPSSYLHYAADGDGDGQIDIWHNKADVFASIANYLATVGWQEDLPWGEEVTLSVNFDRQLLGVDKQQAKTIKEWRELGVIKSNNNNISDQQLAWIILPENRKERAFMVYRNFITLMDWNRSYYFAISVGLLAESLAHEPHELL